MMKKAAMFAAAFTTLGVAGVVGATSVNAESSGDDGIVDKLTSRFNLNRDEVNQAFNEAREERRVNRDEKRSDRLQELVENGSITADQKSAIEAKRDEMHQTREELRTQDIPHSEVREKMKQLHDEFEAWAEEQGIDLNAIRPEHGEPGHGRHHRMGGFGDNRAES